MDIEMQDYNGADEIRHSSKWKEIENALRTMPVHVKESDQANKQGTPIFDPIGTNRYVKSELEKLDWKRIPIPAKYSYFGTDFDLGKEDTVLEVQFSNYPFLFSNVVRLEFFFRSKTPVMKDREVRYLVIVTKGHMFPASNSTLYYEQAKRQLDSLITDQALFKMPIRLVGLVEASGTVDVVWTKYSSKRYSREVASSTRRRCTIHKPTTERGRSSITY